MNIGNTVLALPNEKLIVSSFSQNSTDPISKVHLYPDGSIELIGRVCSEGPIAIRPTYALIRGTHSYTAQELKLADATLKVVQLSHWQYRVEFLFPSFGRGYHKPDEIVDAISKELFRKLNTIRDVKIKNSLANDLREMVARQLNQLFKDGDSPLFDLIVNTETASLCDTIADKLFKKLFESLEQNADIIEKESKTSYRGIVFEGGVTVQEKEFVRFGWAWGKNSSDFRKKLDQIVLEVVNEMADKIKESFGSRVYS